MNDLSYFAIREKINRKFEFITNIQDEAIFFLELINYLTFVMTDQRLQWIIDGVALERDEATRQYNEVTTRYITRLNEIATVLKKRLMKYGLDIEEIDDIFHHFDGLQDGSIQISPPFWGALETDIYDICHKIIKEHSDINLEDLIIKEEDRIKLLPKDHEISQECHELERYCDTIKRTAIWHTWDKLKLVLHSTFWKSKELQKLYDERPLTSMGLSLLIGEMKNILSGFQYDKRTHFIKEEYLLNLKRLHNYILDNLDKTRTGLLLLKKYKQKSEWYNREEIIDMIENRGEKINRIESRLTIDLAKYLHDNGVIPLSRVIFGRSEPDLLGLYSGEELFPIEVKVLRQNQLQRLRTGFNQILDYLRIIGVREGYYIIFCRGNFTLDIPDTILTTNNGINIITIDLYDTPPSTRTPNIWEVTEEMILREKS